MPAKQKKLKILYVGNFNTLSVGEPEIAKSLEELGHEVITVPENNHRTKKAFEDIKKGDYDFVLFAKFRFGHYGITREVIKDLKAKKIPTVCWLFDLYYGL